MNNLKQQLVVATLATLAFFALLGWAGDADFTDHVILSMSQEEYDNVKRHLTIKNGRNPSESEIAHWWVDHRNK